MHRFVIGFGMIVIGLIVVTVIRYVFFLPLSVECQSGSEWLGRAPHGAIWKQETVHWDAVPTGYTALVGWINAVTDVPCTDLTKTAARVEIRRIRIIARNVNGHETILREVDPSQPGSMVGRLFPRVPKWFGESEGRNEASVAAESDGRLTLDLGRMPLRVYHAWTEPRLVIDPADQHLIEVEANISSTARLQFGIDYWRNTTGDYNGWDPTCESSSNCEGWVSDWYGDTGGSFQTLRAPLRNRYGYR